jgi:hypothetical protein
MFDMAEWERRFTAALCMGILEHLCQDERFIYFLFVGLAMLFAFMPYLRRRYGATP